MHEAVIIPLVIAQKARLRLLETRLFHIRLNMDEKDKALIDDTPDEDAPEKQKTRGYER